MLERYRPVDWARKVVGVGSVGTDDAIVLLLGDSDRDPLFLQVKEAQASVLERFAGRSRYRNHGQRVVAGQRLTQAASDIFLGWTRIERRDYYVRQLRDMKGSVSIDRLSPEELTQYAGACGEALAGGHARSGDRVAISAYLGAQTLLTARSRVRRRLLESDRPRPRLVCRRGGLGRVHGRYRDWFQQGLVLPRPRVVPSSDRFCVMPRGLRSFDAPACRYRPSVDDFAGSVNEHLVVQVHGAATVRRCGRVAESVRKRHGRPSPVPSQLVVATLSVSLLPFDGSRHQREGR